jgi:hypothetical protein
MLPADAEYRAELEAALQRSAPIGLGRIVGGEAGLFLLVDRDNRGVEIYRGEGGKVVIDPAVDLELMGELIFPDYEAALAAAARWLSGCQFSELGSPNSE